MIDVVGILKKENGNNTYEFYIADTNYRVKISDNDIVSINKHCYLNEQIRETVLNKILIPILGEDLSGLTESMDLIEGSYEKASMFYDKTKLKSSDKIYELEELNCKYVLVYIEDINQIRFMIRHNGDGLTLSINQDGTYIPEYSLLQKKLSNEELLNRKVFLEKFIKKLTGLMIHLNVNSELSTKDVIKNPRLFERASRLLVLDRAEKYKDIDDMNTYANESRLGK